MRCGGWCVKVKCGGGDDVYGVMMSERVGCDDWCDI